MQFVIQEFFPPGKPDQRRYYLRLEREGKFESWAVPKGMPGKGKKHLAIEVGSLRLRDGGYEGKVSKGFFGPGEISIWDQGDYREHFRAGDKIILEFSGSRVKGGFALVRFPKAGPKHWLLGVTPLKRPAGKASPRPRRSRTTRGRKQSFSGGRKEWPDKGRHEIDTSHRPRRQNQLRAIFRLNKSAFRSSYGPRDWLILLAFVLLGLAILAIVVIARNYR